MATKENKETKGPEDRRIEEMSKPEPKVRDGKSDEELLDEAKENIHRAGDLYGTAMARDDRELREQRANIGDPNVQH